MASIVSVSSLAFLAGFACLVVHELDAIRQREWRFFFARVPVDDETAYRAFVAVHAPALVLVALWLDAASFRIGLDVFLVAHAGVHLALREHPLVEFDDWFSWTWIAGGAVFGLAHLALTSVA